MKNFRDNEFQSQDPTGLLMSEKLDGVWAEWTGRDFISKLGNVFPVPAWFKVGLPARRIQGELWIGRGQFEAVLTIVQAAAGDWSPVRFKVFDVDAGASAGPDKEGQIKDGLLDRLASVAWAKIPHRVQIIPQVECAGPEHFAEFFKASVDAGAEGVFLRARDCAFDTDGTGPLGWKHKPRHDAEAKVVGYTAGKGEQAGRVGALVCEFAGKTFKLAAGLNNKLRAAPPKIGALVTFAFSGLTKNGIPKCAVLKCARNYE